MNKKQKLTNQKLFLILNQFKNNIPPESELIITEDDQQMLSESNEDLITEGQ